MLIVADVSKTILKWTGGQAFTGRLFGNREEMRAVMQESAQAFTSDERAMINRVLDLQNFTVGQIATPVAKMVAVEKDTPVGDAHEAGARKKCLAPAGLGNARWPPAHCRVARGQPAAVQPGAWIRKIPRPRT